MGIGFTMLSLKTNEIEFLDLIWLGLVAGCPHRRSGKPTSRVGCGRGLRLLISPAQTFLVVGAIVSVRARRARVVVCVRGQYV